MAATNEYSLLCLENPLLDIQATGDQALLDKYGLKENDAILAEEKHLGLYEDLLTNFDAKLIAGGAAQNTARGAQYILPEKSVVYIGCVGNDKYAATLQEANKQAGLRVEYRVDAEHPTGRCGVIITGHNRSMCTDLAAANHYKIDHLKQPEIWSLVEKAKTIYVGGYHFTVRHEALQDPLAEEPAKDNKTFVVSLSAPFICQFFKEPLDKSAPYWDVVIATVSRPPTLLEVAQHLGDSPKENTKRERLAIITQGTLPTIVATQGKGTKSYPVHAIDPKAICDTNGAGDAFAGGFVAGLVQNKSVEESVDMGQWLARLGIQELGPS
ncbi:hypothetical protein VE04_01341 [Pseudogymnoascus sp. 24MN13]|nr:hypothetical protein VE04_01341 [Pseudogymnoascus sp. 24MN13]